MSGWRVSDAAVLDDRLSVSVERLSKTRGGLRDARYEPAVSVFALIRERRGGTAERLPEGVGLDDAEDEVDEDEDEDEDEEEDELRELPDAAAELRDVSFDVAAGEAVGVVGEAPAAVRTLSRVICGMTPPTSGRIIVRGRVGLSVELARLLTRHETNARSAARLLAALAGPGRRHRRAYVAATMGLAFGNDSTGASLARVPKDILRRIAIAAALEPFAEVLVVDALPALHDAEFRKRCLARLEERLAAGAAVVVTAADPELLSSCRSVIRLDEGVVVEVGAPAQILGRTGTDRKSRDQEDIRVRGFDEHAAILTTATLRSNGSEIETITTQDELRVRIVFEIATPAEVRIVVAFSGTTSQTFNRGSAPLAPGVHVALLRLPPESFEPGGYEIDVGLVLRHGSMRTKVGRRGACRIRVEGFSDGHELVAATGSDTWAPGELALLEPEWSIESEAE